MAYCNVCPHCGCNLDPGEKGIGATKLADIKAILEKHLEVRTDA